MCGRYRLNRGWERDLEGMVRFVNEKLDLDEDRIDVRPTDPMPVIRFVDGRLEVDVRRWGFLRLMPGANGKRVRKQLLNAKSETAPVLRTFRDAFRNDRCLIPLSSWYEWPARHAGKQKVEIAARDGRTMLAAGLCETSTAFDTGEPVETFTMLTTTPTEFLGTVHDRAPLILPAHEHADWLEGDAAQAQALTGTPPRSADYALRDVDEGGEGDAQLDLL